MSRLRRHSLRLSLGRVVCLGGRISGQRRVRSLRLRVRLRLRLRRRRRVRRLLRLRLRRRSEGLSGLRALAMLSVRERLCFI